MAHQEDSVVAGDNTYYLRGDQVFKKHGGGEKLVTNADTIFFVKSELKALNKATPQAGYASASADAPISEPAAKPTKGKK